MINLSLNELKLNTKSRRIKGNQSMSIVRVLSDLNKSESAESEKSFDNATIKEMRKEFNKLRNLIKIF